jgi:hypothetical protein
MAGGRVKFGLTLPNRGVVIGATTVAEMLQLAADADASGWDSVWVGDSIFAKPRLDAMVLMGAIAARTTRVRIGPAGIGKLTGAGTGVESEKTDAGFHAAWWTQISCCHTRKALARARRYLVAVMR